MLSSLIGKEIVIIANEFIEENLSATIIMFSEDKRQLLLKMSIPLHNKGNIYPYAIVATRLENENYSILLDKGILGCNITWIPENRINMGKPFDLSWWRGGASTITSIKLKGE